MEAIKMKKMIKIDGHPMEYYSDENMLDVEAYYGFVYVTKNLVEEKFYVGSSAFVKPGAKNDIQWENYLGSGVELSKAIKEFGRKNFKRIIIDVAKNEASLRKLEKQYIGKFEATQSENWYNAIEGITLLTKEEKEKEGMPIRFLVRFSTVKNADVKLMNDIEQYCEENGMPKTQLFKNAVREYLRNNQVENF